MTIVRMLSTVAYGKPVHVRSYLANDGTGLLTVTGHSDLTVAHATARTMDDLAWSTVRTLSNLKSI